MVNFTVEQMREVMDHTDRIRNISVIAHVDHGKSTLTDSLIAAAGIISMGRAGNARFTDTRSDEQERCITIKSTGVSLYYEFAMEEEKEGYLINLIDSPGHVDFSSEVTAALRVTDGALVVVDAIEGVCVQTETVLRQALGERVVPVLMLNKADRVILELQLSQEEAYQSFCRTIETVNVHIATYQDEAIGKDLCVGPMEGTVAFGSGLHGWGFTLNKFAEMYCGKMGSEKKDKFLNNLWGDRFFNKKTKKWGKKQHSAEGKELPRGFCMYILDPIYKLFDVVMHERTEEWTAMCAKLGIKLNADERELRGKHLLKNIMQKFLPAAEALIEMIIKYLPSPRQAQKYRVETLYTGPMDDEAAEAIRQCDKNGPLMLYISKMVPTSDKGRFYAFGRVFSGTVATGQKVRILGADYVPGKKKDLTIRSIQRTVLMMGRATEMIDDCPCGNTIALVGIDQYIVKNGTLTTLESAHCIRAMKFSVSPVVRVAVEAKNPSDLPKLVEGLKRLAKSDPCVQCYTSSTGEHVVAGAGELHLEICLKDLQEDFCGFPLKISNPVVSYMESISGSSDHVTMGKSANKHNRIHFECHPLHEDLVTALETGALGPSTDKKEMARELVNKYEWDSDDAKKIWGFGPHGRISNLLVDSSKGVQYLHEIKDHVHSGFQRVCEAGALCEEELTGVAFHLMDATLHPDAVHRGAPQVMPATRRACLSAILCADPILLEPFFLVEIAAPETAIGGIYSALSSRRGHVFSEEQRPGQPILTVKAYLPVGESFGFDAALRAATGGQAFPQCVFHHYGPINSDPLADGSQANELVIEIRERKGLKSAVPTCSDYEDRL
ncbi:hypothetical protein KIPB_000620 [Kipferlia bialata]|uniref:Tr-type G domain-containing protein n=1 Tax=Kipferlia bialata TaxID=797122 RepID=A0A9K3CPI0_9EUKA|nr:hypothetical protein KIPB_000620 [Kipferlia bialata]|eukprot:g620.t1